ncbi:MAG: KEOPS complex kinase/ATPase Bud32 [Candidatus Bathyarchaeota archaeon]|nr:KEOPS complex kinase/ATPase Bud32 [Candidatus Bathyarchaeota archaeon]
MEENTRKSITLVKKGAEANLYLSEWRSVKVIVKKRIPKKYRVAELDKKIRNYRTIHEAEYLFLARKYGVPTPIVLSIDNLSNIIVMEYIEGQRVKEAFEKADEKSKKMICKQIGNQIGRLHKNNLIHGDLTSSNMIISDQDKIYFIDFGLSFYSNECEDMGVDLYLLKRAFFSTHYKDANKCHSAIRTGYIEEVGKKIADRVFKKSQQIERRGRYFVGRSI